MLYGKHLVTGKDLRPGMKISKEPVVRLEKDLEILKQRTGSCDHGLHFGNGCFDVIGKWWVYD